jgi:hypothetical protein
MPKNQARKVWFHLKSGSLCQNIQEYSYFCSFSQNVMSKSQNPTELGKNKRRGFAGRFGNILMKNYWNRV